MANKTSNKPSVGNNAKNISKLEFRIKELELQNAELLEGKTTKSKRNKHFFRSFGVVFFVTVTVVTFMLFNISSWAKNTILDTDTFVSTMQPVLAEPSVQEAVTNELTSQLFATINIQSELQKALPENLQFIAGPLAGGVENFVSDQVKGLLASPQVYDIWGNTLETVQSTLVAYIQDPNNSGVVSINDLYKFLGEKVSADSQIGFLFNKQLPSNIGNVTITEIEWLPEARQYLNVLSNLPIVLIVTSLISFLIAIALALNRRTVILTVTMLSLVMMIATVIAINIGQIVIADQVQPQYSEASEAVYTTITNGLKDRTMGYATLFAILSALMIVLAPSGFIASVKIFINRNIVKFSDKIIPKTSIPDWLYWLPENKIAVIWTVFGVIFVAFGLRIPPDYSQILSAATTATLISVILYLSSVAITSTKK